MTEWCRSKQESQIMSDEPDVREKVEQTETGYKLYMSSKRGTGTRDQNEVSVTGRAETLETLRAQREEMRELVIEEMQRLREHQPDRDILDADERKELEELLRAHREGLTAPKDYDASGLDEAIERLDTSDE